MLHKALCEARGLVKQQPVELYVLDKLLAGLRRTDVQHF
jgi:hypothetical protein